MKHTIPIDKFIKDKATTMDEYDSLRNEINLYLNDKLYFIDLSNKAMEIVTKYFEEVK
jgi:hypothetical protein